MLSFTRCSLNKSTISFDKFITGGERSTSQSTQGYNVYLSDTATLCSILHCHPFVVDFYFYSDPFLMYKSAHPQDICCLDCTKNALKAYTHMQNDNGKITRKKECSLEWDLLSWVDPNLQG